jgi:predicted nucleic acid-binding protein
VPQVLYELWVVATRPKNVNGLGLTASEASAELTRLQSLFLLLPDTPQVFPLWSQLVAAQGIVGKNAHDARLVAAMAAHGVRALLTFNVKDFARFSAITVIDPSSIAAPPTP